MTMTNVIIIIIESNCIYVLIKPEDPERILDKQAAREMTKQQKNCSNDKLIIIKFVIYAQYQQSLL